MSYLSSDAMGLLMFLRLHLLLRVIRDYSALWTHRREIVKAFHQTDATAPNFDWWLTLKNVCFRFPVQFGVATVAVCVLVFGYCISIVERPVQPDLFTVWTAAFLALQCIVTGKVYCLKP
jgi:hypothetical protein